MNSKPTANSWISARRLQALCRKEMLQIVRDPSSILIAFILPVGLLFIFGLGVNLDTNSVRIGVLLEDNSRQAQLFGETLAASPFIDAIPGHTGAELERKLKRGEIRAYVVVKSDFARRLNRARTSAPVEIVTDGSEPNTASFAANYVQGAWRVWLQQRGSEQGISAPVVAEVIPRYWFNPSTISRNYLLPGSLAVIMTIIGALLTSLVIAREWERGTMEALLSTPVTRTELLLSKVLPYYALGLGSMLISSTLTVLVLDVPFRGSVLILLLFTSLFLGSALGLGLLISTLTRNQFNAAQAALNAGFLPATMLSGFVYDIDSMPALIRAVTYLIPARYFVSALQTIFQVGAVWSILIRDAVFLIFSAVFFLGLTAISTRRRLD
jgi:ABC-2 type transport system permease protein